ncbi:SPFH domain-containing protein [Thermophilibacter sp. ET337]|uniref:SPFH domain-containing protein n=1 Tax=Thermophilibacter sp. ET337 TaxID=2973084 RepID=UPI0021ACAB40|nr:SPFH domain-containing protein [Thermophilibacter sp. ET337]MCR8908193.1 SPFH domain-containing protein [Thermophilibacter sp. ET337]
MGILDAAFDSIGGVLADQWKDIVTAAPFDEHTIVSPGIRKNAQNGRGGNFGAEDILSNGSIIFVPENTAAFVFSQAGIEQVITTPGGFEYRDGEASVFDERDRREKGLGKILLGQAADRIGFSGMSQNEKRVAFVNLREIRGLKFGTRGPLAYNDLFYGTDLEIYSYGSFTVAVCDAERFVRNFVPANVTSYTLDDPRARGQLLSEFLNSYIAAVNSLSVDYRVSQLPSQTNEIAASIAAEDENAGTWPERFGLKLVAVAIENIEFSEQSRELVRQFSEKKMGVRAYEDVSQRAANVAAQQMIAQGVRDNGLGDGGGMLFGMNLAQSLSPMDASAAPRPTATPAPSERAATPSLDDQIEALKKLKDLLDAGILSQEEFDAKKREVLGL